METVTLEKIHEDLVGLKKEMEKIKILVQEDYELSDDIIKDISLSRARPAKDFVSHEKMRQEFG